MSPADQEKFQRAVDDDCDYAKCIGLLSACNTLEENKESLYSLVSGVGVGFKVCAAIISYNNITLESLDDCSTEDELIAKLQQSGIHNTFHQRVLARNIPVWRSHTMARDTAALPFTASDAVISSVPSGGTLPIPKEGIKLSLWDIFVNECGGRSMLKGLSTTDVNNLCQKPLTIHMKSSYCDYLKTRDSNSVGEAQVFVYHSSKYKFLEVLDTLKSCFHDNPNLIIWFDLFSLNQHNDYLVLDFESIIYQFNHMVFMVNPWSKSTPFKRLCCTSECHCTFDVAMSPADQEEFQHAIEMDCDYAKCLGLQSCDMQWTHTSSSFNRMTNTLLNNRKSYVSAIYDYVDSFIAYTSSCFCNFFKANTSNNILELARTTGLHTENLYSLVLDLGDGFEVCAALLQLNNITIELFGDCSTEDELIAKLKESGIHSPFHQRVLARNIPAWRSHSTAAETSAQTLTASDAVRSSVLSEGTLPFPKEGIKLSSWDIFINECGGRSMLEGLSTTDVNNLYQKPLTVHMKSSYCDYLMTRDSNSVGEALVFVSHSVKFKFIEVFDTLKSYLHDNPDIIIWFDLFSMNQHYNYIRMDFEAIIHQFNHMVFMVNPWSKSTPLKRLCCTSECHCTFDVAMSPADQEEFQRAVDEDCDYAKYIGLLSACNTLEENKESLYSLVSGLGDGFEVCRVIAHCNSITIESLDDSSTEDELIAKLKQSGIRNTFHQRVLARNIPVWRSHTMARESSAHTVATSSTAQSSVLSVATLPFPKEGIKLSSWDTFINECGGRSMLEGLSTTDVNNLCQKPLTIHMKSSYCDYLKTRDSNSVGEAQVFISHAWKYAFLDVVDTLQYHFWYNPDIIIWFDLFSNNQHSAPDLDFHWWSTTFKSAIEQFNHTVLILSPWNNPIPLTRAWCLFEIYCTAACKCRFEVAMSPSDQRAFMEAIATHSLGPINAMLAKVDARKSESWNPADKTRIFDAVERTVGFARINSLVFDRLRDWVIETATVAHQSFSNEEDRAFAQQILGLLLMNQGQYKLAEPYLRGSMKYFMKMPDFFALASTINLVLLYDKMGNYEEALSLCMKCFTLIEDTLEERHPFTFVVMCNLASLYRSVGRYEDALSICTKCLAMKETVGEKDPDVLSCMNLLAELYRYMGRYDDALSLLTQCLAVTEDIFGAKHPDTLKSMNNLAVLYENMGRFEDSLSLCVKSAAMMEELLGENHPSTLVSFNNLIALYCNLGRYDDALPLFAKCLAVRMKVLGEKHPDTLASMNNLAGLCIQMGKYDEAEPICTKCLALMEEVLGEKHHDTLLSMSNLALLFHNMGRYDDAFPMCTRCFAIHLEVLGERHPNTLLSACNLASLHVHMGRYYEALPLLTNCLAIMEEVLGEKHPSTLHSMNNLASLYCYIGRYDEALLLYMKCIAVSQELLGEKHPFTLQAMSNLANLYVSMGKYYDALPLHTRTLAVNREHLGEKHPDTIRSMNNLAALYRSMERYDEALPLQALCLALTTEVLGEKHLDALVSMNNLGLLYEKSDRYEEALSLYTKCLASMEEVLGEKHSCTIACLNNLAQLYVSMGKYDEALSFHTRCLAIREETLGERHPDTLISINNLASLYQYLERDDAALPLLKKCLALRLEMHGETHPYTLTSMHNLAVFYSDIERYDDALPLCTKCLAIQEKLLGEEHSDTIQSMKTLAALYYGMGRYDELISLFSKYPALGEE